MATIECKTYSSNGHIHKRAYQASDCYDLFAAETKVLKPWGRALIKPDFSMSIPEGYYGRIGGHSGLANMYGIIVHDGRLIRTIEVLCAWSFSIIPTENIR